MFFPSFDGQEELGVCTDICHDLRTFEFAESNFPRPLHYSVKGRLKASIEFWHFIGAPKFILDIISDGYKIPFITTPPPVHLKNNGSALEHSDFVNGAILELLQDNRIQELIVPPEIINPLTVSVQSSGKKRLILDLRTFAPIVSAHPYCARKCTRHVIHERALSNKMRNDRAKGHCYNFAWI